MEGGTEMSTTEKRQPPPSKLPNKTHSPIIPDIHWINHRPYVEDERYWNGLRPLTPYEWERMIE